ncbi:response regulator [Paenibacillus qinlingensis]|uniref:Two-component system response regulator YesN n=1 Tax=Paenibacillus qinlingensis TaxID=1837343 RepID=A0ABU1P1U1_9BACL|nr:response regulator [Paenibacillus qinlingensis]MDR6553529.1 two-component system response regulator YesN [Paenibacillus qinlingensis]
MNILVIDDEALVRESVVMQLRNFHVGMVAEAKDGIEGLDMLRQGDFQLVIADIRMPGMDGLTLMSTAKQQELTPAFVFISGYDLFSYAKQAVQLGAIDYLLKPIKEGELLDAVNSVRQSLRSREQQQESLSKMEVIAHHGIQSMRKQFFRSLTRDDSFGEPYLQRKFQELEIHFAHRLFCVVCLSVDHYAKLSHELNLRDRELIKFSVENITSEALHAQQIVHYPFDTEDGIGFVLNYSGNLPEEGQTELKRVGEELCKCIERYTKQTVTVGIGTSIRELSQLKISYEASQKAILQRLIRGGNHVFIAGIGHLKSEQTVGSIPLRCDKDLLVAFERKQPELALASIQDLLKPYHNTPSFAVDAAHFTRLNFQLILVIFKHLRQVGLQPEEVLGEEFLLSQEVNACDSVDHVVEWFSDKLNLIFEAFAAAAATEPSSKNGSSNHVLMEKAKLYIRQHYGGDITLDSVAQHVNLSPSYFSKLFKDETSENFHTYVLEHRMNVARALLKEGVYKANQVAGMVGFQDEKYFYKVFKKMTGFTPSEYRQL